MYLPQLGCGSTPCPTTTTPEATTTTLEATTTTPEATTTEITTARTPVCTGLSPGSECTAEGDLPGCCSEGNPGECIPHGGQSCCTIDSECSELTNDAECKEGVCDTDAGNYFCKQVAAPIGTTCREAVGECDIEEFCDGVTEACPDDEFVSNGDPCGTFPECCRDGVCDLFDECVEGIDCAGSSPGDECIDTPTGLAGCCSEGDPGECIPRGNRGCCIDDSDCSYLDKDRKCKWGYCSSDYSCFVDAAPAGTLCRRSTGTCDPPEYCDGVNTYCPANIFEKR